MKNITKYLPDILILLGIWIFAYVVLFPIKEDILEDIFIGYDYSNYLKFISILLISIGVDIGIRRLIAIKNK